MNWLTKWRINRLRVKLAGLREAQRYIRASGKVTPEVVHYNLHVRRYRVSVPPPDTSDFAQELGRRISGYFR